MAMYIKKECHFTHVLSMIMIVARPLKDVHDKGWWSNKCLWRKLQPQLIQPQPQMYLTMQSRTGLGMVLEKRRLTQMSAGGYCSEGWHTTIDPQTSEPPSTSRRRISEACTTCSRETHADRPAQPQTAASWRGTT